MPPKRRARRARRGRRSGPPKNVNPRYQVSSIVETYDPGATFLSNVSSYKTVFLNMFPRAKMMANLFEQYQIEEVKYVYTPLYNTYQESASGATIPIMYVLKDRAQALSPATITLNTLTEGGAQKILFNKPVVVKYKPNTLNITGAAQAAAVNTEILQRNAVVYDQWFPCVTQNVGAPSDDTPNTLSNLSQLHYGHWVYFQQGGTVAATPIASVVISVRVSFKNPMINASILPNAVPWRPLIGTTQVAPPTVYGATGYTTWLPRE